jgi:NitT/TauT family transport system substrate-binding protein
VPGFNYQTYLVSNRTYDAGAHAFKDFPGHSFGLSQIGSPPHYSLALIGEKYGFDLKNLRIMPLQSIPNIMSAIIGGQVDFTLLPGTTTIPAIQRGEVKLLGWAGAETPYQLVVAFAATKTANERGGMIRHFLNAYRNAARDYHDALSDGSEQRRDGRNAGEILDILARYTGITVEQVKLGIPWVDGEQRVDVRDVLRQIAWYQSQGMVKGTIDGDAFIDKRYVVPLPEH